MCYGLAVKSFCQRAFVRQKEVIALATDKGVSRTFIATQFAKLLLKAQIRFDQCYLFKKMGDVLGNSP